MYMGQPTAELLNLDCRSWEGDSERKLKCVYVLGHVFVGQECIVVRDYLRTKIFVYYLLKIKGVHIYFLQLDFLTS